MPHFLHLIHTVNRLCTAVTQSCGRAVSWLTLVMALCVTVIVVLRVVFSVGSIGAQEAITYMHVMVLMVASAYTLQVGGHVRVDIFYRRFSLPTRAWVNTLGTIVFLMPMTIFILLVSWGYVANSWAIKETSADAGGLPAVFLLKSLILANSVLLLVQAVAELAKGLSVLTQGDDSQETHS